MLKRTFLVLGLVGCLSVGALADPLVNYTSADDVDPGTTVIELMSPSTTTVDVSVSSTTDADVAGTLSFMFGTAAVPDLTLSNWVWDSQFDNVNNWFPDATLPNPVVVGFSPNDVFALPVAPAANTVATVTASIAAGLPVGTILTLSTGAEVFDEFGAPVAVDPASDNVVFQVVPEPATLALLLVGGFSALRRRR